MPPQIITAELVRISTSAVTPYKRRLLTCVSPYMLATHIDEAIEAMKQVNPDSRLTGAPRTRLSWVENADGLNSHAARGDRHDQVGVDWDRVPASLTVLIVLYHLPGYDTDMFQFRTVFR